MNRNESVFTVRIYRIAQLILLGFCLIFARLIHLQIMQWRALYIKSQRNCLRIEVVPPLRGNILDYHGKLLATNRPTINLLWQGTGNRKLSEEQISLLNNLEIILEKELLNSEEFFKTLSVTERLCKQLSIANDLTFEQHSKIVEQLYDAPNLLITTHFKRHYPQNTWACHVVGYLGRINKDVYGKMGLEKMFEETLRGQQGERVQTVNAVGRHLDEIETKKALCGDHIQTTLDLDLQAIIEEIFPLDWSGSFLIMDPQDGSIRALLSRPNFDPAIFLEPIDHEHWLNVQERHPFLNRACNACYPPGSLFKLVTLSALLEQGYITPESHWFCKGYVEFAGREYHCNNKYGHGYINTEQALAFSCNVLFFELGKRISIDLLADYAHRYGLGQKTTIMFAEKTGLIPDSAWKRRTKGEKWWPGETLSASIGQSYLLVTPMQIARMVSSIFTGSLINPRILASEPIIKQPLAIKSETRKFLQQSMKSTITQGTGSRVKQVKDIVMYAKTSTAQTVALDSNAANMQHHGWFAGYFYYGNHTPLTIVILIEHAGSSLVATTMAKEFLIRYKKVMDNHSEIRGTV